MGSLFSTLDIARSGMYASRVQLDVAGHNIANVNQEGYSRQRVELGTPNPVRYSFGLLGRGVSIQSVRRVRDSFLDSIARTQVAELGRADIAAQYYQRLEDSFLEPGERGFGIRLNTFFDALNDFANNVEEYPVREALIASARDVAGALNELANRLNQLRTNANEEVRNVVPEINDLAGIIASTNRQIRAAELDNSVANDIRDERDRALDQLARLVNINYTETADGQVTVRIAGDVLIDETGARTLTVVPNSSLDPVRNDLLEVRFADTGSLVSATGGELYGSLQIRDTAIPSIMGRLNTIAGTMIEQINRIHSQSNGTVNRTGTVTSSNAVTDPTIALTTAGLPFSVTVPGSFQIAVYDSSGNLIAGAPFTVSINAGDSLNDLASAINAVAPGTISAVVNADNTLSISAGAGYSYTFANDTAGILTALGINGLFTGTDARTIAVNSDIIANPGLLSSGFSLDPLATGDNTAALQMAALRNQLIFDSGSSSFNDYYESTIAQLGVEARANNVVFQTETAFADDFARRREEVSGVSIDEEVTQLLQYQRAFEAAARLVTVTDRMLDALLGMGA
ncbi:MAG TPA: flagellar hook-associated protein FlgK [Candidatus Hydrogenedentes bacterium]|nr:flagellar hook-associated protein FlgK [Candidatus Hydrogenedentota bacterium]HOL76915.1 flagellar hook-associated protein FlgK [Candidatus Hydrogenedentota bacterium]HPO85567.1 flagellar hook-associated protein FlgK [Candidatus Hydrogenedentota bacterium]